MPEVYQIPYNACWSSSIPGINAEFRILQNQIDGLVGGQDVVYIPLEYPGALTAEEDFGFWEAPSNCQILGTFMTVAEPSTGNDITMDYVNGGGVEQGKISTLATGLEYQATTFGVPLAVTSGTVIRGKIKSTGSSGTEGAYLTALAIIKFI